VVTGLIAAVYWYKASVVKVVPKADGRFGGGIATPPAPWVRGALDALEESSRLNRTASIWTAVSVLFNALSNVAGQI